MIISPDKPEPDGVEEMSTNEVSSGVEMQKSIQSMRGKMRRDFLELILTVRDSPLDVEMYETGFKSLKAVFKGIDPNFEYISVTNLHTPIGVEPSAILRVQDCIALNFEWPNK